MGVIVEITEGRLVSHGFAHTLSSGVQMMDHKRNSASAY